MDQVIQLIRQLASDRFFGTLAIKFESGKVVVLKKEETIKPQYYRNNRGKTDVDNS
jgi:hypothetical protein